RPVALEDLRARLRGHALGAEEVLDGERDALVGRRLLGDPDERVELVSGRALAVGLEELARAELAAPERVARLLCRQLDHACGLGTRKPSSVRAGAAASATSRGRQGRGSSARSALAISTTCEVGGTPSRSSSSIFSIQSRTLLSSPTMRSTSSS